MFTFFVRLSNRFDTQKEGLTMTMNPTTEAMVYYFKDTDILDALEDLEFVLPEFGELDEMMRERRVALLPVDEIPEIQLVTRNVAAFLRYIKLSQIRTVMCSYGYYTKKEVEARYELRDSDRRFFRSRPDPTRSYRARYGTPSRTEETDYSGYIAFSRFLIEHLDLSHPNKLIMHTQYEGSLISCIAEDDWIGRLPLPDAEKMKAECLNPDYFNVHGAGCVSFFFRETGGLSRRARRKQGEDGDGGSMPLI